MKLLLLITALLCGCSPVVKIGAGFAYVETVPGSHLSGHEQFHLSVQAQQPINDRWSIVGGWNHYSNGAGLGIGNWPNGGLDFYGVGLEYVIKRGRN